MPLVAPSLNKPIFKLLKVGADVEMFLKHRQTEEVVPCVGVVHGTKNEPLPLPDLGEGFARQEDNVMLEFNVPAVGSKQQFVENMQLAMIGIDKLLQPLELTRLIKPSHHFKAKQLASDQAQTFGCDPDFNVWDRAINEIGEIPASLKTLRTAGGHVHVSFTVHDKLPEFPKNLEILENMVMLMDFYLGIPFACVDSDFERKQLYGKAGAFRVKPYGVEYRTLSNVWIQTPARVQYVFEQVQKCIDHMNLVEPNELNRHLRQFDEHVKNAVNKSEGGRYRMSLMSDFNIRPVPNA